MPARVAEVIYDNLRIRQYRLDHCVDADAASYVRARLDQVPADARPLYEGGDTAPANISSFPTK